MKTLGLRDPAFLASTAGGAGYATEPDDFAGLVRWYKARDYDADGLGDGANVVNNMIDYSVTGDPAVPDGTYPPHYRSAITALGGSAVEFPDGLHHFDFTQIVLGDFTVVILMRGLADAIMFTDPSGNYQIRESTGGTLVSTPYYLPGAAPVCTNAQAQDTQVWFLSTMRMTISTGVPQFSYNKSHIGEDTGDTNTANMKISQLGLHNGGPGYFRFLEACIYTSVLSDANVDALYDDYFSIKYAGEIGAA